MTPDPSAAGDPSSPQSWNLYNYASGDPVNGNDPTGLDDENGDNPGGGGNQGDGVTTPNQGINFGGSNKRVDNGSAFPECNRGDNPTVEKKLTFISNYYAGAMTEAGSIQKAMGSVTINTQSLAITFLAWSMWETAYGGGATATINNNYFGNAGQNSQYSVTCPPGAASGPACYSDSFDWLDQLSFGLSMVPHTQNNPNPTNQSYGADLESLLTSNPNASTAQILQVIGNAGWNPNPNYGNQIGGGAGFPGIGGLQTLINCLKKNGYL